MINVVQRTLKGVLLVLAAAYPVFIYVALIHWGWELRYLAGLLALLIAFRLVVSGPEQPKQNKVAWLLVLITLLAGIAFNSDISLRFYPVIINLVMLYTFSISLLFPPSVIERLARLTDPELGEAGVRYTKNLTKIWCLFFLLNGSIAAYTALYSSYEVWGLYNGFIAYILIGLMFAVELPVRIYVKKKEARRQNAA